MKRVTNCLVLFVHKITIANFSTIFFLNKTILLFYHGDMHVDFYHGEMHVDCCIF